MPLITIDGRPIEADPGSTVLEAALKAGIYVPHLCFMPDLAPYGGCRLCVVEIEGMRGLPAACTTPVSEGMVVHSDVPAVNHVRRVTAELIIADHQASCLSCTSNQRCELQRVAAHLGIGQARLRPGSRRAVKDASNPFFERDMSKCVLCTRCVRLCHEVRGVGAIDVISRGYDSRVAPFWETPIVESTCESCGMCVDACPVGALRPKSETLPPAEWVRTICPYCGCGCGLVLGVRGKSIVQVRGDRLNPSNHAQLCVKGRFGLDFVSSPERLTSPLIRRNGKLEPAAWDEALALVAGQFSRIRDTFGPDALAGFSSAKCTNEENFIFQKFMRAGIGTNNVDHCARLCHASTVAGLTRAFGSGAMTNSAMELENADCILVTGSNTTEAHPVVALRIKAAVARRGADLIVADPRRIDLTRFARLHLRHRCGTDVMLLNAMMHVIVTEGLEDRDFIAERTENFASAWEVIRHCPPEAAEAVTGVPAGDIREAAVIFARAGRAAIVYSMGITQHTTGTDNVLALANLAMLTGNVGLESGGVYPLRGQNNVQGACDMGALPDSLPGYQKLAAPGVRRRFQQAWGRNLPEKPGLTAMETLDAVLEGRIRSLYIMGENPALSDPNVSRTRRALEKLDFLVVQDIFLTETAEHADVVLPGASFAEKDGTFTSTERRVQRVRKALPAPGEAKEDLWIICALSGRMGYPMRYSGAAQVMAEIAALTPIYGGISYERLDGGGLQWPCPDGSHPGTPYLHRDSFSHGRGRFHPTPFREAAELPDEEYPLLLSTGRLLHHFHTGTLSRKTGGLETLSTPGLVEVNPEDAKGLGIVDGDKVLIESRRGRVQARAAVTGRARRGMVFLPFHFRETPANALTNDALDPSAKIPEFKVCAVRVRQI
ncbi:MAG: formate dehydrogenase subunit alpha [Ammonifex sp.]|nr:MAG: formate dehydrogenase subunit alpha [Ammonifex sp.]